MNAYLQWPAGRLIWPLIRPWLPLGLTILVWAWAVSAPYSGGAPWALAVSAITLHKPFRNRVWPVIGPLTTVLAALALLGSGLWWFANHWADEMLPLVQHWPGADEASARSGAAFWYILFYSGEMVVFIGVAVLGSTLCWSCSRHTYRIMTEADALWPDGNDAIAKEVNRAVCATLLAAGAIWTAVWWDSLSVERDEYSGNSRSILYLIVKGQLYHRNSQDDTLLCKNFGSEDLVHWIGNNRVDVIGRVLEPVRPGWQIYRERKPKLNVECQ